MTPRTSRSYWLTLCLVSAPIIVLLVHMTRGALGEPYIGYNDIYGHDRFDDVVELLVSWAVSGVLIVIYAGGLALIASELREGEGESPIVAKGIYHGLAAGVVAGVLAVAISLL